MVPDSQVVRRPEAALPLPWQACHGESFVSVIDGVSALLGAVFSYYVAVSCRCMIDQTYQKSHFRNHTRSMATSLDEKVAAPCVPL